MNLQRDNIKGLYQNKDLDTKVQFIARYNQYRLVRELKEKPKTILEVGIGNGAFSQYLHLNGYKVTTCDYDLKCKPDIVADVRDLSDIKKKYDVVCCFEVLEHMPFEDIFRALYNLYSKSKRYVIISLPHAVISAYISLRLPLMGRREGLIVFGEQTFKKHKYDGDHYWEMGKEGYPIDVVRLTLETKGFKIEKEWFDKEHPYHHYFVMKKVTV